MLVLAKFLEKIFCTFHVVFIQKMVFAQFEALNRDRLCREVRANSHDNQHKKIASQKFV